MAEKKQEQQGNRVLAILMKEYPAERVIMGILGIIVIVLGVYLIEGETLVINNTDDWWNSWIFGTDTGILIFSIFITVVGVVAFFVAIWPFFQPSIAEMKKVTWPNGSTIRNHSLRVFGFILFLAGMFIVYDAGLKPLFGWLLENFGG
jgi:preprotein translocase subunit SecE